MKKQDRRVAKTKKSIEEAVLKLMAKKDYNSITITDIANEADINRKTFYNYYNNIGEVMDEIELRIMDNFRELIDNVQLEENFDSYNRLLGVLKDIINENNEYVKLMMRVPRGTVFFDKIIESCIEISKGVLVVRNELSDIEADIICTYIMTGTISTFRKFFNEYNDSSITQVEDLTTEMSSAAIRKIFARE